MTLNHLNLAVPNVAETTAFFEAHFGFRCLNARENGTLAILEDDKGFILAISNFDKSDSHAYPKGFHFGFVLDSRDEVRAMHERLRTAGVPVRADLMDTPRGLTFYGTAPGAILFEVCSRP